jgi:hypothetical protein
MFSISDKDIAAIVAASEHGGELSATIEVRRLFPGIPKPAEPEPIGLVYHPWRACHPPGGCHEPVTDGAL